MYSFSLDNEEVRFQLPHDLTALAFHEGSLIERLAHRAAQVAMMYEIRGEMSYDRREQLRQEYVRRINRVLDYVRENLAGDLRLEKLARVANFSPYHFHRIFHGMTGETLNRFIRRVRIETAAAKLLYQPKLSITRVAVDCGYSSPSSFAREFRDAFGMSASQFREGGLASQRKSKRCGAN